MQISQKYSIDKRTLKKCWLSLKLITEDRAVPKRVSNTTSSKINKTSFKK